VRLPVARVAVGLIGLAAAVYAGASLTGNWLSTPPWWKRPVSTERWDAAVNHFRSELGYDEAVERSDIKIRAFLRNAREPRPGRVWISLGVGAVGLALAAFAAWPRRLPSPSPPPPS
jgi:hypothetical protein